MSACSSETLALAVIRQAYLDYRSSNFTDSECRDFLAGKTEIAVFWFDAAGLPFLTGRLLDCFGSRL